MFGSVAALPFVLGLLVGIVRQTSVFRHPAAAALVTVGAAVAIQISLEGIPALPPVRSLHRFPLVIGALGLGLAMLAVRPVRLPPFAAGGLLATAAGGALWWMAPTILANNPVKAGTLGSVLLLASIAVAVGASRMRTLSHRPTAGVPQAALATSLAAAFLSLDAGYIGLVLFNGALAAFFGGLALVSYVTFLHGNEKAFAPRAAVALADMGIAFMGVAGVVILAPQPSVVAVLAIALTLSAPPFAAPLLRWFDHAPRAVRPVLHGLALALPALAAILAVLPGLSG